MSDDKTVLVKNCVFCGKDSLSLDHMHRQWSLIAEQGFDIATGHLRECKVWYASCGRCLATYPLGNTKDEAKELASEACDYLVSQNIDKLLGNSD